MRDAFDKVRDAISRIGSAGQPPTIVVDPGSLRVICDQSAAHPSPINGMIDLMGVPVVSCDKLPDDTMLIVPPGRMVVKEVAMWLMNNPWERCPRPHGLMESAMEMVT